MAEQYDNEFLETMDQPEESPAPKQGESEGEGGYQPRADEHPWSERAFGEQPTTRDELAAMGRDVPHNQEEEGEFPGRMAGKPGRRPASLGYDIDTLRPAGVSRYDPLWGRFRQVAAEHGISQRQVSGIVEMWNGLVARQAGIERVEHERAVEDLNNLLMETGDGFNYRVNQAHSGIRKLSEAAGAPGLYNLLLSRGLLSRPEVIRFGMGLSRILGDDAFVSGERGAPAELDRTPGGEPLLTFNM